ncbi:MAG: Ig-like domain-containing protein [Clostridia bacterium]
MKRKIWLTAWLTLLILAFAGGAAMADEAGTNEAKIGNTQVEIRDDADIKMNFYSSDKQKYYTTMEEATEDGAKNISVVGHALLTQSVAVQAGTSLTVPNGKKLEVSTGTTLTVNGTLTLFSDAQMAVSGQITAKPGSTLVIDGVMDIGIGGKVTAEVDSKLDIGDTAIITDSTTKQDGLEIWTDNVMDSGDRMPIQSTKYRINYGPAGKVYVLENTVPDDGLLAKGKEVKLKIFDEYRPWFTGWTVSPAIDPSVEVELKAYDIKFNVTRACTVTATFASPSDPEAAPLKVTPGAVTVEIGKTARLVASKDGAAVAANWLSNALRVVSVDENGLVYGLAEGSTTVTAMFGNERASCTVTVTKPVTPGPTPIPESEPDASETVIGVWTDELAVAKKGALELPKLKGSVIEWTSDNLAVARIGKKGLSVVGLAFGEATLTGIVHGAKDTSLDGRVLKPGDKLTVKVCVRKPDELAKKIVPSSKKVTLAPQETAKLTVSVSPASAIDDKIYWKSENPKIATVTKDGTVTAVAPGKVKLVALSTNLKKTSVMVTVTGGVTKITLTPAKKTIAVGETLIVSAQVNADALDKTLTWTVGKKGQNYITLTENPDGTYTVTALKPGKAKITVKSPNGKKAVCTVTVK